MIQLFTVTCPNRTILQRQHVPRILPNLNLLKRPLRRNFQPFLPRTLALPLRSRIRRRRPNNTARSLLQQFLTRLHNFL